MLIGGIDEMTVGTVDMVATLMTEAVLEELIELVV